MSARITALRSERVPRQLGWVFVLASVGACGGDREALQQYLSRDFGALTADVPGYVADFGETLTGPGTAPQRADRMRSTVIDPYREVVDRLAAFATDDPGVDALHRSYVELARRQLGLFVEAEAALRAGRSLNPVAEGLARVRAEMEDWMSSVRARARAVGLDLQSAAP